MEKQKKAIVLNAGPRKNWNTALMLRAAQEGAEAAGAVTEYVDLYDLNFTGCRSCLACKRKGAERNKCYWNDDLSPLIEKILQADAMFIGAPIYLDQPAAQFRAVIERLGFCVLSYDGGPHYFEGKLNVGVIYTMNAPRERYDTVYKSLFVENTEKTFARLLHGEVRSCAACNTLQVEDYSLYNMARFNEQERRASREQQFPLDLQEAFKLGMALTE